ncbi:MAG: glycine cleavage system regulatory protein [Myxococcota bacterium]|jgi:glycine cleavage system regulatory protein
MKGKLPFSITLGGPDSPGLMARICGILAEAECELSDCRLSQLVGDVIGIMVVYAPVGTTTVSLTTALKPLKDAGLTLMVREPPDEGWVSHKTPFSESYMVSYEGGHRPDVLGRLSAALSVAGCHFTDVNVDAALGDQSNAFVLVCEIIAPLSLGELRDLVDQVGAEAGVSLGVMPADMDDIASGMFPVG